MQRDRSRVQKKQGEKKQQTTSLQDHHNSNNHHQSTNNQPLQDLQWQLLYISGPFFQQYTQNSATMATISNSHCPWKKFYKHVIKYMNSLHIEACKHQIKIAKSVFAVRHNFASPTMDFEKDKKSTKQLQGSKKSTKQSKKMVQDTNNSTKGRTSNSDTDSAYNTESESNHTAHLPRPPCSPKPTRQHLRLCPNKSQQLINTKCMQGTRPSCIPIPKHTKNNGKTSHLSTSTHLPKPSTSTPKTSYLSTSTHLQKPSTSTQPNIQTTMKQPTVPAPKTSTASTYPQRTGKTPLLPTPPASARNFNYRNHYKQHIPGPSPSRYSTYSTLSGPATLNNYRYYLQPHIPGPHTASLPYLYQGFFTRPYQQIPGHLTPQVPYIFTGPYPQIPGHLPPFTSHTTAPATPLQCMK